MCQSQASPAEQFRPFIKTVNQAFEARITLVELRHGRRRWEAMKSANCRDAHLIKTKPYRAELGLDSGAKRIHLGIGVPLNAF